MGRLGPLTSLAFGRSPFQAPERDEDGNFILGPHAHDFENKDHYVQQFDDRGHPKNEQSKATMRAMEHAQNAVLETVGVVVRREEALKSAWQRQSQDRKVEDIVCENSYGVVMREAGPIFMQSAMWWAISLRRRMQTFRSYLEPTIVSILRSELKKMGLTVFLTDGLLSVIAASVLQILLAGIRNLDISLELTIGSTTYSCKPFKSIVLGVVSPLIVYPAKSFAILQSLHLIPSTFHLSPWSFVPFTTASPIQLPSRPDTWTTETAFLFAASICTSPFVVATVSDFVKFAIHNATYRIILLSLTPRPDNPDKLTIKAAKQDQKNKESILPIGIGPLNNTERLSRMRTSDLWTEIGTELGFLVAHLKRVQKYFTGLMPAKEKAEVSHDSIYLAIASDTDLQELSQDLQRQLVRQDANNLRANPEARLRVQREAHAMALATLERSANDVSTHSDDYLLARREIFGSESTATPEPVELAETATGADILQEPRPHFDSFNVGNAHDREEREGEGRVLASLGFETTTLASRPGHDPPNELGNSFTGRHTDAELLATMETAEQPTLEELDALQTLNVLEPQERQEETLEIATNLPEASSIPPPQAPDSPLERNATPPAISRNRAQSRRTSISMLHDGARPIHPVSLVENHPLASRSHSGASTPMSGDVDSSHSNSDSIPSHRHDHNRRRRPRHHNHQARPLRRSRALTDDPPLLLRYDSLSSDDNDDDSDARARGIVLSLPTPASRNPPQHHRVTSLSVFPAELFAEFLASIVTGLVTLPLDTLQVRSLARGFLGSPSNVRPGATAATVGLRGDVYGLGEWMGGSGSGGRWRYASLMAMMFGLHGCVGSLSWAVLTKVAIVCGRRFGWGQL